MTTMVYVEHYCIALKEKKSSVINIYIKQKVIEIKILNHRPDLEIF
jgi:hypothetical protein